MSMMEDKDLKSLGELVVSAVNTLGWLVLATILIVGMAASIRYLLPVPADTQEVTIEQAE